jgi:hypothetical protein
MALPTMMGGQSTRYPAAKPKVTGQLPSIMGGQSTRYAAPKQNYISPPAQKVAYQPGTGYPNPFNQAQVNNIPQAGGSSQGGGGGGGSTSSFNPYDIGTDPILLAIRARNIANSNIDRTKMTENQKQYLLGFGSTELARQMFGNDPTFVDTVGANPFSTLGQIAYKYDDPRMGLKNQANESLNKNNLFYSSYRTGQVLPDIARSQLGEISQGTMQAQAALRGYGDAFNQSEMDRQAQETQGLQDAANRSIQASLTSGYGPGAANTTTTTNSQGPPPDAGANPYPPKLSTAEIFSKYFR